jgi:hypothetical protein
VRQSLLEDLALGVEVETELEFDPIAREGSKEQLACLRLGHGGGWSVHHLTDPPLPDSGDVWPSPEELHARIAALDNATRHGCRVIVKTRLATVVRVAWVRNVGGDIGLYPPSIAENVAQYLAFKQARELLERHGESITLTPQLG